jgi:predicted enzyme related to lactoylglutathione lyase
MLRGLSTVNLWAEDLPAATRWYTGGVITYWHVDEVAAELERLVSLGAKQLEGVTERGPGFVTASVVDPFGNVLGVMYNRHYLEILSRDGAR